MKPPSISPSARHDSTHRNQWERPLESNLPKLAAVLLDVGIRMNPAIPDPWDILVRDKQQFERRILSPLKNGLTELGDMFVEGIWECEDISAFFFRCLNSGLNARFRHCLPNVLHHVTSRLLNRQSKPRAARDVSDHYDLGPVFEIMLDPLMTYTCAYWKEGISDLAAAQEAKHDLSCRKLALEPGMNILDIGCGWGGFLKFAAANYRVQRGMGISLSRDQVALGMKLCKGLPISLVLQDYRDVGGTFDRVASFGMFEHVGPKNYRTYFRKVHEVLKPGGLFLLHNFGSIHPSPTLHTPEVAWINDHIFPGLVNPSFGQIATASDGCLTLLDVQEFGAFYDPTLMAWHRNFVAGWPAIKHLYDERFYRKWRYYLQICAAAFRSGNYRLWQTVFGRDYAGAYSAVR